jgi:hypothetical protein
MEELTEQEISEFTKEFQRRIEEMLWSELSLSAIMKPKEPKIEIELEYQSDYAFYMNRYWFSMPYPKSFGLGIINITS